MIKFVTHSSVYLILILAVLILLWVSQKQYTETPTIGESCTNDEIPDSDTEQITNEKTDNVFFVGCAGFL
ncbi:hypothetical protein COB52_01730 [Candidatus Kaiserbacteria bacterium]|nr:MAG: hypothetical protein COB52_01730 [Candidatus Kaiserbacteria bacterium]